MPPPCAHRMGSTMGPERQVRSPVWMSPTVRGAGEHHVWGRGGLGLCGALLSWPESGIAGRPGPALWPAERREKAEG